LLQVTQASVQQADQVQQWLAGWSDATAQRLESALQRTASLVQQVIAQTERRVLQSETVPASAKLVSLFEPHTTIVRRGKAHLPAEFDRKVVLDKVEGGLVTRYAVLDGNPPDAPELPTSLAHHQMVFEHAPAVLTAGSCHLYPGQ
jgi:IS5 family transposase